MPCLVSIWIPMLQHWLCTPTPFPPQTAFSVFPSWVGKTVRNLIIIKSTVLNHFRFSKLSLCKVRKLFWNWLYIHSFWIRLMEERVQHTDPLITAVSLLFNFLFNCFMKYILKQLKNFVQWLHLWSKFLLALLLYHLFQFKTA